MKARGQMIGGLSGKKTSVSQQVGIVGHQVQSVLARKGLLNDILGVVAFGSLARGEGLIAEYCGRVKILSDLDLALVSQDRRISAYRVSAEIPKILKALTGSFKVSMGVIKPRDFDSFRTLLFLDIKRTGKILFGDLHLSRDIDIEVSNVPLWEGLRLLLNNGVMQLLQAFSFEDWGTPLETIYGCNKAYLACCDALLLLAGTFPPTILKRSEILEEVYSSKFPTLSRKVPFLPERIRQSARVRTRSTLWSVPRLSSLELSKMWFEASECCIETVRLYMMRYFGLPIKYPSALGKIRVLSSRRRASMLYELLKRQKLFSAVKMLFTSRPPVQAVHLSALFLLGGINVDKTVDPDYLQVAQKTLQATYFLHRPPQEKNLSERWLANRDQCIRLWKDLPQMMIYRDNEIVVES